MCDSFQESTTAAMTLTVKEGVTNVRDMVNLDSWTVCDLSNPHWVTAVHRDQVSPKSQVDFLLKVRLPREGEGKLMLRTVFVKWALACGNFCIHT